MKRWLIVPLLLTGLVSFAGAEPLQYEPAPVDNPLKGLVPYASPSAQERFPHSMQFRYFPMRGLIDRRTNAAGQQQYVFNWEPIEKMIRDVSARGCQAIFRVHLEYPGREIAVPQFLIDDGVKIIQWTAPQERRNNFTPDYEDPRLRKVMKAFIAALGEKYDGDPRVGFITAGMLGKWGEWHDHPRNDLFPGKEVQQEVMDAYAAAFKTTKILLRYPAGPEDRVYAANHRAPFGYHDDSFAFATLDTGEPRDGWFFMTRMKTGGPEALAKWRTYPIGGELRPELWPTSFTDRPDAKAQDFLECVERTHVTWLMDTGFFSPRYPLPASRYQRAIREVRRMGYELHVADAEIVHQGDRLRLQLQVENRGVAPFYYDWPVELAILTVDSKVLKSWKMPWRLTEVRPEKPVRWQSDDVELPDALPSGAQLALRVPNPMPGGRSLRFANATQRQDESAWLLLGPVDTK